MDNFQQYIRRTFNGLTRQEMHDACEIMGAFTPKQQTVPLFEVEGSLSYDMKSLWDFIENDTQSSAMKETLAKIEQFDFRDALSKRLETPLTFYKKNGKYYLAEDGNHRLVLAIARYYHEICKQEQKIGRNLSKREMDKIQKDFCITALVYDGEASVNVARAMNAVQEKVYNSLPRASQKYVDAHTPGKVAGGRLVSCGDGKYEAKINGARCFGDAQKTLEFIYEHDESGVCAFFDNEGVGYVVCNNTAFKTKNPEVYVSLTEELLENSIEMRSEYYVEEIDDDSVCKVFTTREELCSDNLDEVEKFVNSNFEILTHKLKHYHGGHLNPVFVRYEDEKADLPALVYENLTEKEKNRLLDCLDGLHEIAFAGNIK